ncbi:MULTISPECIES: hypothetical protein [Rhodococcus]|uniref:hypothetical protein n=1 Tax=Rhodococcus TaxID=1827 RepID=UPI000314B633|nr:MULTISPECIES: hypothetical protein [Rhodococcus]
MSAESENKTPVVAIGRRRTLLIEDDTDVLFEGVVVPPHGWIDHVRALGAVGVIAGAGITSRPGWERQLPRLARESELLGSVARVTLTNAFGRKISTPLPTR